MIPSLSPQIKALPGHTASRIAVRVTPAAERAVRAGHPWLFADGIRKQSQEGAAGDLAIIFDRKGRFLAIGLYDPHSLIRVRILHQGEATPIDQDWFEQKLASAAHKRQLLLDTLTNGYRLIHGENDGLPGLVIDRYQHTYVLKLYSAAWVPYLPVLLTTLGRVMAPQRAVLRLSQGVAKRPEYLHHLQDGAGLFGPPVSEPVIFQENGLYFAADLVQGQKTGFFLDQRDNRARVEKLAAGKSVLNVFAYSGGFSLYAARGGATHVASLDSSGPALAAAEANFGLNQENARVAQARHELIQGDAFSLLAQLAASRRRFQMVVIDPPSFAHRQAQVDRALTAYGRLVRLGLELLQPGGTLVMASCSSRVPAVEFFEVVHEAARQMQRPLRELERTFHPLDHPIGFAEGAYLKCLFAEA